MKQSHKAVFLLGMFLTAIVAGHAQTIVISTVKGSVTPIAQSVMKEAYRRLGMKLEVQTMPGERALQSSNSGQVDGELYRKKDISKAYPNLIVIPVPVVSIDENVFTKGKRFPVTGWGSLVPYTVGYRIGIKIIEDNLVKGTKAEPVATLDQLFKKLDEGRTDVVIETNLSGLQTIKKLRLTGVIMLEPPIVQSPLFHCLNVKNKRLVEPLTTVLRQMEKEGTIKTLQQKAVRDFMNSLE